MPSPQSIRRQHRLRLTRTSSSPALRWRTGCYQRRSERMLIAKLSFRCTNATAPCAFTIGSLAAGLNQCAINRRKIDWLVQL